MSDIPISKYPIERRGNREKRQFYKLFHCTYSLSLIFVFLLDKCILFIYLIKLFFPLLHLNGCSFPWGNSKNMNNNPFQNKIIKIILILIKEWQLVSPAKQLCVTTKKMFLPARHTDRRTDRQTPDNVIPMCRYMLRRRHKNHNTWKKRLLKWSFEYSEEFMLCQRIVYIHGN